MKTYLLSLALLVCFYSSAQAQKVKINDEFFILGTLDDYMGKRLDPREKDLFDRYYHFEIPLANYVEMLVKTNYPDFNYEMKQQSLYTINSADLQQRFAQYYDYKPSKSYTVKTREPILYGTLKHGIFKNNEQKLSFLAGAFVRFGSTTDTAYCIRVANSMSKAQVCDTLLREFNCKPNYTLLKNIPVSHIIYFHPDKRVKAYLDHYDALRIKLQKSLTTMMDSIEQAVKKRRAAREQQH